MNTATGIKAFNFADIALSLPIEALESALKKDPDLINIKGYGGQTALHKSVLVGNHPVALILLRYGANPNVATDTGETCLHIACGRGALKLLLSLLNFGGDLNIRNHSGQLPLHCASRSGSIIVIHFLCDVYGCNLEVPDASGATLLHGACAGGHLDLVRFLLEVKKVSCFNVDSEGNTILHKGAIGGVSGVCWHILKCGGVSLLSSRNKDGQTPVQVARSSLSVSRDCKTWLEKWTNEYLGKKKISSPKIEWLLLLLSPFFIFHSIVILSRLSFPESQWTIGVPGFIVLLLIMKNQHHRMNHPARWANPFYVGACVATLFSSILLTLCFLQSSSYPVFVVGFPLVLFAVEIYFLIYLLTKDPGEIPSNEHVKEALVKFAEDCLEGRFCLTCSLPAPAASHHCRLCEKCFLLFDHHCLFLNTCIAANNHWHFIVFIIVGLIASASFVTACIVIAPVSLTHPFEWVSSLVIYWLYHDIWTFLLVLAHILGFLWVFSLLRYQYQVIGSQQTTYLRLKSGSSNVKYSTKQKLFRFLRFLYYKKVAMKNSSHYFKA